MISEQTKTELIELFRHWSGETVQSFEAIQAHGSERRYFRLREKNRSAIGVYNPDVKENKAFVSFSRHFHAKGLPVPQIYEDKPDKYIYLEEDLGDDTLFSILNAERPQHGFSERIVNLYKKVIDQLPRFQVQASKELDFSVCYPRSSFDRQSMMWDLNYFKYYFLKLAKIPFDEQHLEDDFHHFCDFLLDTDSDYFLYRDFQSRNVMIIDEEPYFIDYQGGRKGALHYDLASLLYDAKADIPQEIRNTLLDHYIQALRQYITVDKEQFLKHYYGYVYIRIMQALGAYGFRGFYERKEHFLKSVPYAIQNLEWLLHHTELPVQLPALFDALNRLVRSSYLRQLGDVKLRLTARLQSFSYKRGIPWDEKGHGGGFVFDCRFLPNPGRFEAYQHLTGNDQAVINFFKKEPEVKQFLNHVKGILDKAISNYKERNFTDLLVTFGCTGGQHRSIYCANQIAKYLQDKHHVDVEIRHREMEFK